uniref:Uncharacterized protein n=1 Tax=Pseudo-nitzschia australis TaxID=44445 RepID=A0A7S4AIK1_9STRA
MDTTERPELRVVAGGCRDFCSVGPNVHLLAAQRKERPRAAGGKSSKQSTTTRTKKTELLESFSNTKDPSSCDGAVKRAIAWAESTSSSSSLFSVNIENQASPSLSSPMDRHRSMMARKAERTRWETLKDVSRTIARCKKTVAANTNTITSSNDNDDNSNTIERKLRIWKESCKDGIERAAKPTARTTQREQRRTKRLVEIASETLDRICRDDDDESDSDSDSDTSSSSNENDSSDE